MGTEIISLDGHESLMQRTMAYDTAKLGCQLLPFTVQHFVYFTSDRHSTLCWTIKELY
jgi:hypothetical protein